MFSTIQRIRNQHGQCSLNMTSEMRHQNKSRIRQIIIHILRRLILYRIHTSLLIAAMQSLVGISRNWTQLYSFRMSGSEFHNMDEGRKECGTYQICIICLYEPPMFRTFFNNQMPCKLQNVHIHVVCGKYGKSCRDIRISTDRNDFWQFVECHVPNKVDVYSPKCGYIKQFAISQVSLCMHFGCNTCNIYDQLIEHSE